MSIHQPRDFFLGDFRAGRNAINGIHSQAMSQQAGIGLGGGIKDQVLRVFLFQGPVNTSAVYDIAQPAGSQENNYPFPMPQTEKKHVKGKQYFVRHFHESNSELIRLAATSRPRQIIGVAKSEEGATERTVCAQAPRSP
jgi:hypothetical protein